MMKQRRESINSVTMLQLPGRIIYRTESYCEGVVLLNYHKQSILEVLLGGWRGSFGLFCF